MQESLRKKILVVDDDPMFILSMKTILSNSGYQVVTANDGKEGLEKIKSEKPDLVTVDAFMRDMNGYELTRKIRAEYPDNKLPIIMLTGMRATADAIDARSAGASEFFSKPVDPEKLLQRIKSFLQPKLI